MAVDKEKIKEHIKGILLAIGEDPEREGLRETPDRVARMYEEVFAGISYTNDEIAAMFSKTFEAPETRSKNDIVLVKDIELYSMCEHHMLPFIGKCHVAYIPNGKITGLSKIARVVETYARRLQVQERLTVQIRDCIMDALKPLGVAVVIEAMHTCMSLRGVQKSNAITTTSAFSGIFLSSARTRNEFLNLIK